MEYCATHLTDGSYFIYDNLTEPIENPSMVAQLDELAEKIALLEQKADKERADEDTLRDLQEQYANMEQWRYFSSAGTLRTIRRWRNRCMCPRVRR